MMLGMNITLRLTTQSQPESSDQRLETLLELLSDCNDRKHCEDIVELY